MQQFLSNGKLLLTGEYVVLDGALALAVPTRFGQSLQVEDIEDPKLIWKSYDENGQVWFEDEFLIQDIINSSKAKLNPVSQRMGEILNAAKQLNPEFLNSEYGYRVTTRLDFPRQWGLGTSSTLIHSISSWAKVDAYALLELTFGGSGYDIACAAFDTPITYQLKADTREVQPVVFNPSFKNNLYFVYLNQKQDSREGIKHYKANVTAKEEAIAAINTITSKLISCNTLYDFEQLIILHEELISELINVEPVKARLFPDFEGSIKSLGAWGGDFVMVSSATKPDAYFKSKGYNTIIPYASMIK